MYTDHKEYNVTQEEYFAMDGVSNSDISIFLESPKRYALKKSGIWVQPKSKPMTLGSAFDILLLTPDLFEDGFAIMPDVPSPSTAMQEALVACMKAGLSQADAFAEAGYKRADEKTWELLIPYVRFSQDAKGREVITQQEYENLQAMVANTLQNPWSAATIRGAKKQRVFTAVHEATGLLVKGMLDLLDDEAVIDVKSTGESVSRFPSKIFRNSYDRQLGHYCELARRDIARLIAVEREGLNEVDCFELSEYTLQRGKEKMHEALLDLHVCQLNGFKGRPSTYKTGWVTV